MDVVGRERLMSLWRRSWVGPTWCGVYARPERAQEGYDRPMRRLWLAIGVVLIGAGLVWMAQGLRLPGAPGSFMTGQPPWVAIGLVTLIAGVVTLVRGGRA